MKFLLTILLIISIPNILFAEQELEPFPDWGDFSQNSNFICETNGVASIGYTSYDPDNKMGEISKFKNVSFGFEILKDTVKFTSSYPFAPFGRHFEYQAGINTVEEVEYGLSKYHFGEFARMTPTKFRLRALKLDVEKTASLVATCEKF